MDVSTTSQLPLPALNTTLTGILHTDGSVAGFRGIPYGFIEKRWKRSTPVTSLDREFDAREFGPKCPQPSSLNDTLDFGPHIAFPDCGEDDLKCLNLNVYRPSNAKGPFPVVVWLHGGSLRFGAGSDPIWDPAELVRWAQEAGNPIVAVSINYRLGPFGFICPIDPEDKTVEAGNVGFHDQTLALEWVQNHIAAFGGDPENVTVGGESAGGCSTHAQTALQGKPGHKKLFRRSIMESGNLAVMGFWNRERMDQMWDDAVEAAGYNGDQDALQKMRDLPAEKLLRLPSLDVDGFGVYVDDYFVSLPLFGSEGEFYAADIPVDAIMHGDNGDEGNIFRESATRPGTLVELKRTAGSIFGSQERVDQLLRNYELENADELSETEEHWRLHRFPEDARFYLPAAELVRVWPKSAFYHLSAKSPFTSSRYNTDSYHTLDLLYLFGNFDTWLVEEGLEDHLRLGRDVRRIWLRYIYGAEPWRGAYEGVAAELGVKGVKYGSYDSVRGWNQKRKDRITALQAIGAAKVVDLATRVFP